MSDHVHAQSSPRQARISDEGTPGTPHRGSRRRSGGTRGNERSAGRLFVAPQFVLIALFLLVPIGMAAWVSVSNWTGRGSPFASPVRYIGLRNYAALITQDGLTRTTFMTSLRNTFYFVIAAVPAQTALALTLALALNARRLKGKNFFRTAYYFPSVTSSVAISTVFIFLFTSSGSINAALRLVGVHGPSWLADPRGVVHLALRGLGVVGQGGPPPWLAHTNVLGLSLWDWLSGPSVAWCTIIFLVVWTSTGGYMLLFLAALQDIPIELEEAATVDGATRWQVIRKVIIPLLRPTMFLVLTLGLIGTWQVFDQVYVISQGAPGNTTLTPAYLSYSQSFTGTTNNHWGQGSAIAFLLFALIIVLSLLQRFLLRERAAGSPRPRALRKVNS